MNRAGHRNFLMGMVAVAGLALAEPRLSVNELMILAITPATNTLWGVENPATDGDWQALDEAAVAVIAAATLIADGAAGPSDREWAEDPQWQAYVDTLLQAAADARAAISARDLDALFAANDAIYPPCEECHQAFHPGMQ
jgi:hypothetical protein